MTHYEFCFLIMGIGTTLQVISTLVLCSIINYSTKHRATDTDRLSQQTISILQDEVATLRTIRLNHDSNMITFFEKTVKHLQEAQTAQNANNHELEILEGTRRYCLELQRLNKSISEEEQKKVLDSMIHRSSTTSRF